MIQVLLALTVMLPISTPPYALSEAKRLQPTVTFVVPAADGSTLDLWARINSMVSDKAAVVVYTDDAIDLSNLAQTVLHCRYVIVRLRVLHREVGYGPPFDRALGVVIAHEIEHIERNSTGHDRRGWFAAELGPEELLGPAEPFKRGGAGVGH